MFVSELGKIYDFVPEQVVKERRIEAFARENGRDGVWDILGYYNPKTKEVYICEPKIVQTSMDIASDIHIDRIEAYLILRELVRLHEHIHALIHQKTSRLFPPEIDEPVTVFLSYQLIVGKKLLSIFDRINEKIPPYYRRWEEIKDTFIKILDNKLKEGYAYPLLVAEYPLAVVEWFIEILKNFSGNSFDDLLKHMQNPLSVSTLLGALFRAVVRGWEVRWY